MDFENLVSPAAAACTKCTAGKCDDAEFQAVLDAVVANQLQNAVNAIEGRPGVKLELEASCRRAIVHFSDNDYFSLKLSRAQIGALTGLIKSAASAPVRRKANAALNVIFWLATGLIIGGLIP